MPRQLQLARRDNFFNDPFFADIMLLTNGGMQEKLESFKQKSSALALTAGKQEAAHNLQVSASNDKFMIQLELPGFYPEDFSLKTKDNLIILEAVHEEDKEESEETTSRKYVKEFKMPEGVVCDQLASTYSSQGILTISAPRVIKAPEGAKVEEAMAAASKAYTTDDGRTSVKQSSQDSSQMIAASTQSEDGTSKSSMSFSSSSSSSASTMTSSSGGVGGSAAGGPIMSLGGSGCGMDMDMDSMMKKMMGDMSIGGGGLSLMSKNGTSSRLMSSSSSSMMSSSSSTSTSNNSKLMSSGMKSMGMHGPGGLDIEELSTAGTEFSGPPSYTVQSPRPSVDNSAVHEMSHLVKGSADYRKPESTTAGAGGEAADHTVLLKLKQGDEYKLVLNMQQYSPENITVKVNDEASILTVIATAPSGTVDDFRQTHKVPLGVDLDQMTSSFSSDGILVIKAPRKK